MGMFDDLVPQQQAGGMFDDLVPQQAPQAPQGEPMGSVDAAIMGLGSGMFVPEIASMVGGEQGAHAQAVMDKAQQDHPYIYGAAEWAPYLIPGVGAAKATMKGLGLAGRGVKAGAQFVKQHPELAMDVAGWATTGVPFVGTAARVAKSLISKGAKGARGTTRQDITEALARGDRYKMTRDRQPLTPEQYLKRYGEDSNAARNAREIARRLEIDELAKRRDTINLTDGDPAPPPPWAQ